jgi:hypothetical protein
MERKGSGVCLSGWIDGGSEDLSVVGRWGPG